MIWKIRRFWNTIKYLRPVQFYGRIWFRLYSPRPTHHKSVSLAHISQPLHESCLKAQSLFDGFVFKHLGEQVDLSESPAWNDSDIEKLVLYNLHYFDDLSAEGHEGRVEMHSALINRWIMENPAPIGVGWEPYPLSLRIVNWIKYFSRLPAIPDAYLLASLASQADFLSKRLEHHLQGNHLFVNAKALVFAGAYFSGDFSDRLLNIGLRLVLREINEQVLDDGGHFELSPMYHNIVLEDIFDLINLTDTYPDKFNKTDIGIFRESAEKMLGWATEMAHPDRGIPFFNDSTFGISPTLDDLNSYASKLSIQRSVATDQGALYLADSGYALVRNAVVHSILDVGKVGPNYIPGHAHADTLSFELSMWGRRIFVNSGTSIYGGSPERGRQRGTSAHNTVVIDDMNSSDVWDGFRVGERAFVRDVVVDVSHGKVAISGVHDGFFRLDGKALHKREWNFSENRIEITDSLIGTYSTACAFYHLHPEVEILQTNDSIILKTKDSKNLVFSVSGGSLSIIPTTWHPFFGTSVVNRCIKVRFDESKVQTAILWE